MTEEYNETFLEMLYHCEERKDIPVVDEEFVRRFSALSEEGQYKAMSHIKFIRQYPHGEDIQREVYQGRLHELCKDWFEDQTETWVYHNYKPPIDTSYWERESKKVAERHAQREAAKMLEPFEGMQDTISLEEAKKELGLS
jgi:hypothetical protein